MPNYARCPLCGSELLITKEYNFCSNPRCNFKSYVAPIHIEDRSYRLMKNLLLFTLLLMVIGLIAMIVSVVFLASMFFFIFIPFILPIPFLRRFFKKRKRLGEPHKV